MSNSDYLAMKRFSAVYGTPKPGAPGTPGSTGPTGAPGACGRATNTGATGETGNTGPTGVQGRPGDTTNTGATGERGQTGPVGPKGCSSGQILYLNSSSGLADIKPTTNQQQTVSNFLTDDTILLSSYITSSIFPCTDSIPPGKFNFVIWSILRGTPVAQGDPSSTIYA
jgi:hypothetical protein